MNDFFSFVRYSIPGWVFIIFFIWGVYVFDLADFGLLRIIEAKPAIFLSVMPIAGFTLGFILSLTYRLIFPSHNLNHIDLINKLIGKGLILENREGKKVTSITGKSTENKKDSYNILTVFWHQNIEKFDKQKDSFFGNLFNAIGGILTGLAFLAVLFAAWSICNCSSAFFSEENCCDQLVFIFSYLILIGLMWSYRRSHAKMYYVWIESTVMSCIEQSKLEESSEITEGKSDGIREVKSKFKKFNMYVLNFAFEAKSGMSDAEPEKEAKSL